MISSDLNASLSPVSALHLAVVMLVVWRAFAHRATAYLKSSSATDTDGGTDAVASEQRNRPHQRMIPKAEAAGDLQARDRHHLSLRKNEVLEVLDDSKLWWLVRNSQGDVGKVPYNYMRLVEDDVAKAPRTPAVARRAAKEPPPRGSSWQRSFCSCFQKCLPASPASPPASDQGQLCDASAKSCATPPTSELAAALHANREALVRLRDVLEGAGGEVDAHTDIYLLRFLLAEKGDEAAAARWLHDTTRWRLSIGAVEMRRQALAGAALFDLHPDVRAILSVCQSFPAHGRARDGGPLNIILHDGFSPTRVMETVSSAGFLGSMVALMEHNMAAADATSAASGSLTRMSFVFCYEGLSLSMINMRFLTTYFVKVAGLDSRYPSLIGAVSCVNAPSIFSFAFGAVRGMLSEDIRGRIRVEKPATSRAALLALAPACHLPAALGGDCESMPAAVAKRTGWDRVDPAERRGLHADSKIRCYL